MAWCCFEALGVSSVSILLILAFISDFFICFYTGNPSIRSQFLLSFYLRIALTPNLFFLALFVYRKQLSRPLPSEAITPESSLPLPTASAKDEYITACISRIRSSAGLRDRARLFGGFFVLLAFLVQSSCGLWSGITAVSRSHRATTQTTSNDSPILYVSLLLVINFEYFGFKHLYDLSTRVQGEYFPSLHLHEVFFTSAAVLHRCDVCGDRIQREALRCVTCNFDLCLRCFKKALLSNSGGNQKSTATQVTTTTTTVTTTDKFPKKTNEMTLRRFFVRSLRLAFDFWQMIVLALIVTVGTQGVTLMNPNLQGRVFDSVIKKDKRRFEQVIVWYVGVQVVLGVLGSLQQWSLDVVARKLQLAGREQLFKHITQQDIVFFDLTHSGQLSSRLNNDVVAMTNPARTILNDLIGNGILLVGGMVLCMLTDWRLTVLALTTVVPVTYAYKQYYEVSMLLNRSIWSSLSDSNEVSNETIGNFRTVRSFGAEKQQVGMFNEALMLARRAGLKAAWVGASVRLFARYMDSIVTVLVLWYGGLRVLEAGEESDGAVFGSEATIGKLIAFQLYWNMVNGAFNGLSNVFGELIQASSAAERVYAVLDRKPEIDNDKGLALDPLVPWEVEINDVSFTYRARPETAVLKKVTFSIPSNKVTALVGRSGSGKSTLMHLLLRLYEVGEGGVFVNEHNLKELAPSEFRQHVGIVAQDTQLFSASVKENLLFGHPRREEVTDAELIEACKAANVHEFIDELEEGYETRIGERGVLLSGGQRQRVAIARCFLRKPKLILLDEATSALDTENEALVQQAVDNLITKTQCTVVLIAHRLSTVMAAHNIVVLDRGQVVEQGTHDDLVQRVGGVYARLVAKQLTIDKDKLPGDEQTQVVADVDKLFQQLE